MNEKKVNKSIVYMISGIVVLLLAIAGSAYAYYAATATGEIVGSAAGAGLELTIEKLSTSANDDLIPLDNTIDMLTKAAKGYGNNTNNFDANKSCIDKNGYTVCQVYKITISNTSNVSITLNGGVTLFGTNTPNIECAKMDDNITVTNNNSCIGSRTLANNYELNADSSNDYYVMVYIKNIDKEQTDVGVFNGTITFTSTQGDELKARFGATNGAETIEELFNPNTTVLNNNITYQYDTVNNLMEDVAGNIRYYGANPNNYVYFNCTDYPSTNCELWRIIGVFDGKIKLVRNEYIGAYSWDSTPSSINGGWGINQWGSSGDYEGADLMKLLNPGYENNTDLDKYGNTIVVNNSLYYNSENGYCYIGYDATEKLYNNTESCDFTNTGLKNDTTRNMITDAIWYTGGIDFNNTNINSYDIYNYERGNAVYNHDKNGRGNCSNDTLERTTSWVGKVGLINPSDYGYAVDFSKCNQTLRYYNDTNCTSNNWMYTIDTNNKFWYTLNATSNWCAANYNYFVRQNGSMGSIIVLDNLASVVPSLYLNFDISIIDGIGSEDNPYRLG